MEIIFVILAIAAIAVALLGFFSSVSKPVIPSQVPAGRSYAVYASPGGDRAFVTCPSPSAWVSGNRDPYCRRSVYEAARLIPVCLFVALVLFGVALLIHRYRRQRTRDVEHFDPAAPVLVYRQEGMPGVYWLSLLVAGGFGVLVVGVVALALIRGDGGNPAGAVLWGGIVVGIVRSGQLRGYSMAIEADHLVWRSPLRHRSLPLNMIGGTSVTIETRRTKKRVATITSPSGEIFVVTVTDARSAARFSAFWSEAQLRSDALNLTSTARSFGADAPTHSSATDEGSGYRYR